eukprot:1380435-Amorphochlora_amoeboformis.AAC.1
MASGNKWRWASSCEAYSASTELKSMVSHVFEMGESKEVTRDCVQAVRRVKNRCIGNPAAKLEVFSLGIMKTKIQGGICWKALVKGLQHYGGLRDFSVQSDHW